MCTEFWFDTLKGRAHFGNLGLYGRTILQYIAKK